MTNCFDCKHLGKIVDFGNPSLEPFQYYCALNKFPTRFIWQANIGRDSHLMPTDCASFESNKKPDTRIYRIGTGEHRVIEDALGKIVTQKP